MKALPPLGALRHSFSENISRVRQSRFFNDRMSMSLLAAALVIGALNVVILVTHIPAVRTDVPIRYSSFGGFDGLGPWYSPFMIVFFGLSITVLNGVLAYQAFSRSRIASFYLLAGAGVVALFSLIISNAFAMVAQ